MTAESGSGTKVKMGDCEFGRGANKEVTAYLGSGVISDSDLEKAKKEEFEQGGVSERVYCARIAYGFVQVLWTFLV